MTNDIPYKVSIHRSCAKAERYVVTVNVPYPVMFFRRAGTWISFVIRFVASLLIFPDKKSSCFYDFSPQAFRVKKFRFPSDPHSGSNSLLPAKNLGVPRPIWILT